MNSFTNNKFNAYSIEEKINFEELFNTNIIGFCYPIYGSTVPIILREFVNKYKKYFNNKKVIILVTQLMFSGDGARVFTELLKGLNYKIILAEHFNMPNNIGNFPVFKIKNGQENKKCLIKANKKIFKTCIRLENKKIFKRGFNKLSICLGLIQRVGFLKLEDIAKKSVKIDNDCNLCGLCVKTCPMDNLFLENNKINTNDDCTFCYRCVNFCPKKAITTLINEKPKKQYKGIIAN